MENLYFQYFRDIDLADPFFDSLKASYSEFTDWFSRKAASGDSAYVLYYPQNPHTPIRRIQGFMYLKPEEDEVSDIEPPLPNGKHLKIGTFKFISHGTRLGERFMKKVFEYAVQWGVDDIYVTAFDHHGYLIELFNRYGFIRGGSKDTHNGRESYFVRPMKRYIGDVVRDYPYISSVNSNKYLLAIEPEFHTRMLPDSILHNESADMIQDVSHTNSIHKIYLSGAHGGQHLKRGDILIMYRKAPRNVYARYASVATSICVIEEVRNINEFSNFNDFKDYCISYSIFSEAELARFYRQRRYPFIIRFTYNCAMQKRVIRDKLISEAGLNPEVRWTLLSLSDLQFRKILNLGNINESFIIN